VRHPQIVSQLVGCGLRDGSRKETWRNVP
jgi:hypothetical protein